MNKTQFIRELVFNEPLLIPSIMKDNSYDRKITNGIMYKMLPFRSSIEIEANGSLLPYLQTKKGKDILKQVYSYEEDNPISDITADSEELLNKVLNRFLSRTDDSMKTWRNEFKISIANYTQIKGLYLILDLLKKHCYLNKGSGIHIHINFAESCYKVYNEMYALDSHSTQKLANYFKEIYLKKVEPLLGKYTGDYNYNFFRINEKIAKINLRTTYGSLEFRTAPMTFEYKKIIRWLVGLNQIVKEANQFIKNL